MKGKIFYAAVAALFLYSSLTVTASAATTAPTTKRVSKAAVTKIVRDFRDRLGEDANLYYLVNPPGGASGEERKEAEDQVVHYLWRLGKDPSLDIPTRWIEDLREYELTADEWTVLEKYFTEALTASALPDALRRSLADRFASLRAQVLSPA